MCTVHVNDYYFLLKTWIEIKMCSHIILKIWYCIVLYSKWSSLHTMFYLYKLYSTLYMCDPLLFPKYFVSTSSTWDNKDGDIGDGCFTVGCDLYGSRIGGSDGSLNSFRLHPGIISLGSRGIDAADGLVEGDGGLFRFNGRPLTQVMFVFNGRPNRIQDSGEMVSRSQNIGEGVSNGSVGGVCVITHGSLPAESGSIV